MEIIFNLQGLRRFEMDDNNSNDSNAFYFISRLFMSWNTSGTGWFGRAFRLVRNLAVLAIVVNLLGGLALSMLIEWTEPPCAPAGAGSLEFANENVQFEEWEARKEYWKAYHVNLEDVNQTCRDLNQSWTDANTYLREKFFEYWNKIDWEPVERCLRGVLGSVDPVSPAEDSNWQF